MISEYRNSVNLPTQFGFLLEIRFAKNSTQNMNIKQND